MSVVDLRYARAFALVVSEAHLDPAKAQAELHDFQTMLEGSPDLREVLANPSVPEPQKLKLLDAIAGRIGMSRPARNFVAVMSAHNRLQEMGEIVAAYAAMTDQDEHIAEAEITTARPLDEASRRLLEAQVAQLAGGDQVRATYSEDPSLLGGAVIRLGSTVYDGSVRAQLEQMRQRLSSAG